MFGLSNNKQDNQDDQVMLKNVSKLATDFNSGNGSSQTDNSTPPTASDQPQTQAQPASGFSSAPVSSPPQNQQAPLPKAPPAQDETTQQANEEKPVEAPSTFSFPSPPSTTDTTTTTEDKPDVSTTEAVDASVGASPAMQQDDNQRGDGESQSVEETEQTQSTEEKPEISSFSQPTQQDEDALPSATSIENNAFDDTSAPLSAPIDTAKLSAMKQQAMEHLDPLVEHLDQSPEETFKTTMMMIQANDNHLLLEKALEAAKQISDDKERAQAMLDIINEINYFSQNSSDEEPAS